MEWFKKKYDVVSAPPHLRTTQNALWLLLLLLVPLVVNFWGQQPFELPKILLLRTLVWLLAALTLVESFAYGRFPQSLRQRQPLLLPVSVLGLVLVVTTITAVDWRLALWGSYERGQGSLTLLTYLLLFVLAARQFTHPDRARWAIGWLIAASVPLILLSLAQAGGWQPVPLVTDARSPVYATLGRANFVGAYLAMLTPLTLALRQTALQPRTRMAWLLLLLAQVLVIGLTQTRSAWGATAVALFLFLLLWHAPRPARHWRWPAVGGITLLFLSGPLAVLWMGVSPGGSSAARFTIWQSAVTLIKQRPLLGYGLDHLGLIFPAVYPPELVYYQGRHFFVDRAHNLLLDWAFAAGLPGLLAFGLVLVLALRLIYKGMQAAPPERRALLAALFAAAAGNTANNLTSFDVTSTATLFWLLLGMGVGLVSMPAPRISPKRPYARPGWSILLLVGLLLVGVGTAVWQGNGRPLWADIAARTAQRQANSGNWAAASAAAAQAVAAWPGEPAHHLRLSQVYQQQVAGNPAAANPATAVQTWAQAEAALQTAQTLRPADAAVWLRTARFYAAHSATHQQADMAYRQAAALAPNQATLYAEWGQFHLAAGDAAAAAPLLRQAVRLDASYGAAYLLLGEAELALGRREVALADYQEAARLLPESAQAYAGMAASLWQLGRWAEAETAVAAALQRHPAHEQALALREQLLVMGAPSCTLCNLNAQKGR